MKNNNYSRYSGISSFEDFRIEREKLIFRSKLNEAKLNLACLRVRDIFSVSGYFISAAKDIILPGLSELIGGLIRGSNKEADS